LDAVQKVELSSDVFNSYIFPPSLNGWCVTIIRSSKNLLRLT